MPPIFVAVRQHSLFDLRAAYRRTQQGLRAPRAYNSASTCPYTRFKTEIIHRRGPWRTLEAVGFATLEWVDWFSTRRLLEPIGDVPPAEYEAR